MTFPDVSFNICLNLLVTSLVICEAVGISSDSCCKKHTLPIFISFLLYLFFIIFFWRIRVLFVILIPCFGLLVTFALAFKARVEPLTCMLCHLHTMDSLDSPLVLHLLTLRGRHGGRAVTIHVNIPLLYYGFPAVFFEIDKPPFILFITYQFLG